MKESSPINVQDDKLMVSLGLRPPVLTIDKNVFKHTSDDKEILMNKHRYAFGGQHLLRFPVVKHGEPRKRYVIYLVNADKKKHFHTTLSLFGTQHDLNSKIIDLNYKGLKIDKIVSK